MREDDGVGVVVEDVDDGVGLHKSSDLAQHKAPLKLVFGLVGGRVFIWRYIIGPREGNISFALGAVLIV